MGIGEDQAVRSHNKARAIGNCHHVSCEGVPGSQNYKLSGNSSKTGFIRVPAGQKGDEGETERETEWGGERERERWYEGEGGGEEEELEEEEGQARSLTCLLR